MKIDAIATHAAFQPNHLACVDLETTRQWSYSAFDKQINKVAHFLVSEFGPASGERVSIVAKNCADMLILNYACIRAGAIFVPFNWRLAAAELAVLIDDATPKIIFKDAEFEFDAAGADVYLLSDLIGMAKSHSDHALENTVRDPDLPSTLLYTSGTSGKPKGVMISEINAFSSTLNFMVGNGVSNKSVVLCDMPLFHTAGLLANSRGAILAGATLLVSGGFEADSTLATLSSDQWQVTHYFAVPQMAQILWNHPKFDSKKLQHIEVFATGGAPNPKALIERFTGAGIPMSDGFGMTETGSATGMPVHDLTVAVEKAGSCGKAYLTQEMIIVDGDGNPQPRGVAGDLLIRGSGVTKGYWQQPELSAKAFTDDGWFKTGDVAVCDEDGFYYLVDRKKDMFISGGENVYPAEVEACISEIDAVAEVAVIGAPDEKWGEVGVAFVIPLSETALTDADVSAHCLDRLAKYKVPKKVIITDAIPRTTTGKIQKHVLLESYLNN
jgi:fatty-acyl-CoA synthase